MTLATHNPKVQAKKVTLAELRDLPKPRPLSDQHNPIEHHILLKTLEERIKETLDTTIEAREIAVGKGKNFWSLSETDQKWGKFAAVFAVLKLAKHGVAGTRYAVGIRSANDRSMSHQMIGGLNVFVCDNMAFHGDTTFLQEKHLKSLDLGVEIDEGLKKIKTIFASLTDGVQQLREKHIDDTDARAFIFDTIMANLLPAPKYYRAVYKEWKEPRHDEFKPRTMWSLNNAYTEVMKELPENSRIQTIQDLGAMMGLKERN